jgi:hypothetical protein
MIVQDPELHKLVAEIRDACDTALDFWSRPALRDQQIEDALEPRLELLRLRTIRRLESGLLNPATGADGVRDQGVACGMAIAAAIIADHDPVYAEEILCAGAIDTMEAMRKFGVDAYDVNKLRKVLANIKRRKLSTQGGA